MMVCDSGTRSNKVTSDSFYWGTCHWKMPFLAPEMQQVLAGILAAILWTYFQGGRMCFKKMKSDEMELLRSDWSHLFFNKATYRQFVIQSDDYRTYIVVAMNYIDTFYAHYGL